MKICTKCKIEKVFEEFPIRKTGSKDGRNSWCKSCVRNEYHLRYKNKTCTNAKIRHKNLRLKVLNHYGKVCQCCGESIYEFLCIDHINNDGNKHRKIIGTSGAAIYRWLEKNDYPEGFQVLCYNCNMAKSHYGRCPHEEGRSVRN